MPCCCHSFLCFLFFFLERRSARSFCYYFFLSFFVGVLSFTVHFSVALLEGCGLHTQEYAKWLSCWNTILTGRKGEKEQKHIENQKKTSVDVRNFLLFFLVCGHFLCGKWLSFRSMFLFLLIVFSFLSFFFLIFFMIIIRNRNTIFFFFVLCKDWASIFPFNAKLEQCLFLYGEKCHSPLTYTRPLRATSAYACQWIFFLFPSSYVKKC